MIVPVAQLIGVLTLLTLVSLYFRPCLKFKSGFITSTRPEVSTTSGVAISVSVCSDHVFSKPQVDSITLLKGLGVEGDAHCGVTVQHRSRLHIRPPPPNLRQVHLIQSELFTEFKSSLGPDSKPYAVKPGDLGENITTTGLDLLALGVGTRLHFLNPGTDEKIEGNEHAVVKVAGLRNPCPQISNFQKGLQERCLVRDANREIVERKAGIMTTVDVGGVVRKGASILVEEPDVYIELPCV
jgi:MOSC domain-containing protein YiiM